jgi:hypothetical protein
MRCLRYRAVRHQSEAAVARQSWTTRRVNREVTVAGKRKVEGVAGTRDRSGLLLAPCRPILGEGNVAATARYPIRALPRQPIAELYPFRLEAGRIGVCNVVRNNVRGALLRGLTR